LPTYLVGRRLVPRERRGILLFCTTIFLEEFEMADVGQVSRIFHAGKDFGLTDNSKLRKPGSTMRELYKNKLISSDELELYNEFYSFRNKIIHGEIKDLSDSLTARILDLLWRIVRIFG
jgi:hypothetical protein